LDYIPLVYCVKSFLSASELTQKLHPYFPRPFLIAEISPTNIDGSLPQEAGRGSTWSITKKLAKFRAWGDCWEDCQALGRSCNAQCTTNSFWHEAADAKCLFFARYWGKDNQ
jgi:hypothetical protein